MNKNLKRIIIIVIIAAIAVVGYVFLNPKTDVKNDSNEICKIVVDCSDILQDMSSLAEEKHTLVPKDGIIISVDEASFSEGDTVLDVLAKEMKNAKIHIDYNNVYVKGINNIYEKDCGERSGWQYEVNGESPSVSCAEYLVKSGDIITFVYKRIGW